MLLDISRNICYNILNLKIEWYPPFKAQRMMLDGRWLGDFCTTPIKKAFKEIVI